MGALYIILSAVYFFVFTLASLCLGGALIRRLNLSETFISARGKVGVETSLGMGLWGLIYFPLSAIHWFWADFGKALFIVIMLLAILRWHSHIEDFIEAYNNWRKRRRQSKHGLSVHALLGLLIALFLLLSFLNAAGPSRAWDELVDHLPMARHIAKDGAFTTDPTIPFNGYPALCELLFAPLTGIASELAAVTVFAFGAALILMITGFCRTFLPPGWANPAAVVFLSMPLIVDLMRSALVDIPLACFCFAIFYLIILALANHLNDKGKVYGLFFIAGIFLGLAMSSKYNGLIVAFSWLLVLPFTLLLKRTGLGRTLGLVATLFITAILVACGWYIRNLLLYGNPVYPFFEAMFRSTDKTAFDVAAFTRPEMHRAPWDILLYPIRLTFDFHLIRHWYRAITPAFLCFIPLGLIIRGKDKFRAFFNLALWLGLMQLCISYFMSPSHTRYLLPLWAIWTPAAVWGMARASSNSRFLRGVVVPLILVIPFLLTLSMQGKRFIELAPYFIGRQTKADVISQEMPSHRIVEKMPDYIGPGGKLLSIEPRIYYMPEGTVIGTPGLEAPACPRWDEENTAALAAELQLKGYTHLFVDFSSRQLKHAIAMDFFLATIPAGAEGRYYCYEGIVEEMQQRYGIADIFTREDLYRLSAMGGFDIYRDASGRDWHYVKRAVIEERAQYSRNLKFIRHFWLLENYLLRDVMVEGPRHATENADGPLNSPDRNPLELKSTAVLYRIDYKGMKQLRLGQKRYRAGRLKDLNQSPKLTAELQYPNEDELQLWKKQEIEGMI